MPILAKEPTCYPDNLFAANVPSGQEHWWVFYTRPRSEKAIARYLRGRSVSYFLPLYKKYSKQHGRTFVSWNVLFPSYIFVFGGPAARWTALKTNLIVHDVEIPDQSELHRDLVSIHTLVESQLPCYPEAGLKPGVPVTVTAGPLMGLTGKVSAWVSPLRLIIEVRMLQRAVCVEVEPWMVTKD